MILFTPRGFKTPQSINYDFWRELIGSIPRKRFTLRVTVHVKTSLNRHAEELHVLL